MKPTGDVRYWRDRDLRGMEICLVRGSCHVFPKHAHDGIYAIAMMEEGGSYCMGPGKDDSLVVPGNIATINPGQVHSGVPVGRMPVTYWMLYVDMERMAAMTAEMSEKDDIVPEFQQVVVQDWILLRSLRQLHSLIISGSGRLEKESALENAITRLVSAYGGASEATIGCGDRRRVIRRAQEFLAEDLDEKVSLDEAAQAAGLSRYHFLRVFKKETGVPPHVFRTQRRIERAKQLLKRGMPFADVALETGFTDQSHFSNKFKQFTGATPSQYVSFSCSRQSNFLQYNSEPAR